MTLNLTKCQIFTSYIDYRGHVICYKHLEFLARMTDAKEGLEHPTSVTDLR